MRNVKSNSHCQICQICQIEHNNSPLHVVVSTLANVTSQVVAKDVCLYDWLTNPIEEYQSIIEAIRSETDNVRIRNLKNQLSAMFPSGEFLVRGFLLAYSKLICIDIDFKDNVNYVGFDRLKIDLFPKFDAIAYAGLSASGKGYFVLFVNDDENKHLSTFLEIECAFDQVGINIDTSKKNTTDLRFYSIDPAPYINEYATPFKSIYCTQTTQMWKNLTVQSKLPQTDPDGFITYLNNAIAKGPYSFSYEMWWRLASGLFNELGEAGRYYFHRLSEMEPDKYDKLKTDNQFNSSKKYSDITGRSVRWIIRDAGGP